MSVKETEQKLIRLIVEHHLAGEGRLSIQMLSDQAGISRQAFNRNYKHLSAYVKGQRPVEDLVTDGLNNVRGLLTKCQLRIGKLQTELQSLRRGQELELEKIRTSYITSLMNNDISIKESDEARKHLHKQALHNEKLVKDNKKLENQLNAANASIAALSTKSYDTDGNLQDITSLSVDMTDVYRDYQKTGNHDVLEDGKDAALATALDSINKLAKTEGAHVVLYVDRFLACFDKFVSSYTSSRMGPIIVVRIPLFGRQDLRRFAKDIDENASLEIWVPQCSSDSVANAQRKFSFRNVPEVEKTAADKLPLPSISDGYDQVCIYEVRQGD